LIAGGSAAGKTTLIRQLISTFPRFVVIDITHKGEYAQLYPRHVVEGSIDFSRFSPDEKVQLLTIAYAATLGGDQRSFSEVQFGVLRRIRNPQLERLIADIMYMQNVPQLTKDVLANKLSTLCVEVDEDFRCRPHPSLTKDVPIQPPAVIRITHRGLGDSNFLTALVTHGILLRLLKQGQPEPTLLIIDEYHRIASKVEGIEDPAELQIRIGRHANIHMLVATQNPLDLKPSLLAIMPSVITFQLFGEAAKAMASIMGVDVEVIEALGQGEWLAKLRSGPKSPEMPRRSP
jgi:DNA helicase HerA-like ATPase